MLSDPTGDAAGAYGVTPFGARFAKRWTFYIDRDGIVRHIDKQVTPSSAGQDIVRRLEALGVPKKPEAATPEVPATP